MVDRIQLIGTLILVAFVSVLVLPSQSAASYPTYALLLATLITLPHWSDIFSVPLFRWIILLIVWLTSSALWSDPFAPREFLSILVRAALVLSFVAAFAECQLRGQLHSWMSSAFAIVGFVVVTASIVTFFITDPADGRLNGLGQLDTHVVAGLVYGVLMLFAIQTLLQNSSLALRLISVCAVLVIVPAIYWSDSRNAWLSVTAASLVLVLLHFTDRQRFTASVSATVVIGLALLFITMTNSSVQELLLPRGDSFRLSIWEATLERIASSPWIGLGITTVDDIQLANQVFMHPHSMYLSLLHQGGIVALLLYLVVLGQTARILLRNFETPDAKLAIAILSLALIAHLLDEHELIDKIGSTWFLVWIPLSTAVGLQWREQAKER